MSDQEAVRPEPPSRLEELGPVPAPAPPPVETPVLDSGAAPSRLRGNPGGKGPVARIKTAAREVQIRSDRAARGRAEILDRATPPIVPPVAQPPRGPQK